MFDVRRMLVERLSFSTEWGGLGKGHPVDMAGWVSLTNRPQVPRAADRGRSARSGQAGAGLLRAGDAGALVAPRPPWPGLTFPSGGG